MAGPIMAITNRCHRGCARKSPGSSLRDSDGSSPDISAQRKSAEPVISPASLKSSQALAETQRKDQHTDAETLRGNEVARFVDKDHKTQNHRHHDNVRHEAGKKTQAMLLAAPGQPQSRQPRPGLPDRNRLRRQWN